MITIALGENNFEHIALHCNLFKQAWQVTLITCVCLQSYIEYNTGLFKDTNLTGASDQHDMVQCRGTGERTSAARYIQNLFSPIAMVVNPIIT